MESTGLESWRGAGLPAALPLLVLLLRHESIGLMGGCSPLNHAKKTVNEHFLW